MSQLQHYKELGVRELQVTNHSARAVNPHEWTHAKGIERYLMNHEVTDNNNHIRVANLPPLPTSGIKDGIVSIEQVESVWQCEYDWDKRNWRDISDEYYEDMKDATANKYRQAIRLKQVKEESLRNRIKQRLDHHLANKEPMTIEEIRGIAKKDIGYNKQVVLLGKEAADNAVYFYLQGFIKAQGEQVKEEPNKYTGMSKSIEEVSPTIIPDYKVRGQVKEEEPKLKQKFQRVQIKDAEQILQKLINNYRSPLFSATEFIEDYAGGSEEFINKDIVNELIKKLCR